MTSTATTPDVDPTSPSPRGAPSFWRELPFLVVVAVGLALLVKALLLQAFFIPSESMQHTLEVGDRVLVNKVVYEFRGIHRGEVVVFNGIDDWAPEADLGLPSSPLQRTLRSVAGAVGIGAPGEKDFIKRVIGLPGDRVMCCSAGGRVVVQPAGGQPVELVEPYLFEAGTDVDRQKYFCDAGQTQAVCPPGATGVLVPKGRLWVMGDHRGRSADSRAHRDTASMGTIPVDRVVGRAFAVVWPVTRVTILGVPQTFTSALGSGLLQGAPLALGVVGALPVAVLRRRRLVAARRARLVAARRARLVAARRAV